LSDTALKYLASRRDLVNAAIDGYLTFGPDTPADIVEVMRYAVLNGGKRLRPVLVIAGAELFGGATDLVMPTACGIELIHSYSLVHDDLPCMDDDDLRRGRPTAHKKFGDAMAVLAGDALLTYGFALVAENAAVPGVTSTQTVRVSRVIADACGPTGMVGGQALDIKSEGVDLDMDGLRTLHKAKTGRLITASVETGAILAGAADDDIKAVIKYADAIGLAFQIVDDVLGEVGDKAKLGKPVGSDEARGRTTYPSLVGVEESRNMARSLVEEAKASLKPFGDRSNPLCDIADFIVDRVY
jgi:geranylgeranyl diphosphate synthase type II